MFRSILNHCILIAGFLFLVGPVLLIIASSTQLSADLSTRGLDFSIGTSAWRNYTRVFELQAGFSGQISAIHMLKNSLIVALSVATLTTALSLMSAYALVYFNIKAATATFWLVLSTLLLPLEARFIPTFEITNNLGLINTHLGLVLPVLALALGTFFLRQFLLTLPDDLHEAARLDSAGPFLFFKDIVLPLSVGRAGAVFVIAFMIGWNQYLWPIMISTDESLFTLVRGSQILSRSSGPGMALMVITITPPLLLVWVFQRWFFKSLIDVEKG